MVRKILNTFVYGDRKTKTFLWSVVFVSAAALGLLITVFITQNTVLAVGTGLLLIIDFALIKSAKLGTVSLLSDEEVAAIKENGGVMPADMAAKRAAGGEPGSGKEGSSDDPSKRDYSNYTELTLRIYFNKYKVKKAHYAILIDYCEKYGIERCPAYIWRDRKGVHLLLLESTPRSVLLPAAGITQLTYNKGVPGSSMNDYENIRSNSFVNMVFGELIPDYYRDGRAGKVIERKNLYGFSEGIYVSAQSAKVLLNDFRLPFVVESLDEKKEEYSTYFIEAAKLKILWKDGVYSVGEYKKKIKGILNLMSIADMEFSDFSVELERMVAKSLITNEYAEYYRDNREDIRKKFGR